jgi:hypothetical protein
MDVSTSTPAAAVSPLRQHMLEDMRMRRFAEHPQDGYIRAVRKLATFLGRSPHTATAEELRRFQLHLMDTGAGPVTSNATSQYAAVATELLRRVVSPLDHTSDRPAAEPVPEPAPQPPAQQQPAIVQGRTALEIADNFRAHGSAWREAERGHLSLAQLKVMSAITQCLTAALGGQVLRCEDGGTEQVAFACNSCRNRHCPKCQSSAAKRWLDERQAELLPLESYHVVFTLPAPIADIAYQNKAALYGLPFDIAAQTLLRIAADPKHLGASIGAALVLHTWGSALTHHPHVHGIVPGGGLAPDSPRWIACRPGFFLSVRVLSRLFRCRFLEELLRLHEGGKLRFFGEHAALAERAASKAWLTPLRKCEWVVHAKRPVAGGQAVLAYLSRYTHRVAISNSRLLAMDEHGVTFGWKDYRAKDGAKGKTRHKAMTLSPQEFMRRFLLHVLPGGFHRIRHYGLLANSNRRDHLALARELLHVAPRPPNETADDTSTTPAPTFVCAHCGHAMVVLQVFLRDCSIRAPPAS